jgi:hypothetical protein
MRLSSRFVAPSVIAILSTALLSGLSGTAMSQTATGSATRLPNITVEAPRQVARPQRPEVTPQGSGRVAHRGLGPTTILVVLHRHAGWGEISGHRRESKQVAHAYRGSIVDS